MTTLVQVILAIALLLIWGGLGLSMLLSTIQSMIYEKKRNKRDEEYHAERMESLRSISNK